MKLSKLTTTQRKEYNICIRKINELKNKLFLTDYLALKFAEGELTAEEYAETKANRIQWRKEINELEAELKGVNND